MGSVKFDKIISSPLEVVSVKGGDVKRAIRSDDLGFISFGEAYFSQVLKNSIKAWKMHTQMHMNLIVPIGSVGFVFFEETSGLYQTNIIGESNYQRLTVPPGIWFGFKGLGNIDSLLLNVASICHNPREVRRKDLNAINFDWSKI